MADVDQIRELWVEIRQARSEATRLWSKIPTERRTGLRAPPRIWK